MQGPYSRLPHMHQADYHKLTRPFGHGGGVEMVFPLKIVSTYFGFVVVKLSVAQIVHSVWYMIHI